MLSSFLSLTLAVVYLELYFKEPWTEGNFPAPYTTSHLVCIASNKEEKINTISNSTAAYEKINVVILQRN